MKFMNVIDFGGNEVWVNLANVSHVSIWENNVNIYFVGQTSSTLCIELSKATMLLGKMRATLS